MGVEAVRILARKGLPTRALVRDASRAPQDGSRSGVEIAVGDFDRPRTLDAAVAGVDTLLLISPSVPGQEIAVIDSAIGQGVQHIVKVTNHKATGDSPVDRRRDHARIEAHLKASGLAYTLLAPNLLLQNLFLVAPMIKQTRGFVMSAGDGQFGAIGSRDVSEAAVAVAAAPTGHVGRTYLLTGPELVTYADVAAELTRALGHEIAYHRVTPEQHREAMIRAGLPEPVAASNSQVFGLIAEGDAAWLSDDIATLTGRSPRSLRTFVTDHVGAFE
ncbi:NmrA family NAD(P)-binding protein [Streptomyces noursei]